jgi:membrane-associated phospholipid phosphatase
MFVTVLLLLVCPGLWAQGSGTGDAPVSSDATSSSPQAPDPQAEPSAADSQATPAQPSARPLDRDVSWLKLPGNLEQDQRAIWLSPLKLKERKYWLPTAAVVGTTAGLVALDPMIARYFRYNPAFNHFNNTLGGTRTTLAILVTPLSLYGAGLMRGDSKMKSTALLAGEAVVDAEILTTIFKGIDRRTRPAAIGYGGNFADTWFDDHTSALRPNGSFPSGHTIAAFSVATVIARRYGNHKWVPYAAYGTAALIGFSRITLSAHFASDVFAGAALGYSISRFSVLQQ